MKKIITISLILLFITSCQSAKDAFTLQKKNTTDEFLVEKKSPLVLPPKFGELPTPKEKENNDNQEGNEEVKTLVSNTDKSNSTDLEKNSKPTSVENSILEKIK